LPFGSQSYAQRDNSEAGFPSDAVGDVAYVGTRRKYARYATAANVLAMGVQALVSLLAVRWTLYYLGDERFGLWMTVLGIAGFLSFADMGVGNALVTRIAGARARVGDAIPSVVVTGGITVLAVLAMCVSILGATVAVLLPWERILGPASSPTVHKEFQASAMVFAALFGISLLSTGIRRIYEGLQRGYVSHLVSFVAASFSLGGLYVASHNRLGVPFLLFATFGVSTLLPLVLVVPLWTRHLFRPSRLLTDARHELRHLLHVGSQYTLVQVGSLLMNGSEPMLVASIRGAPALAGMAVVQRLFQIAITPARLLIAPYWGAYADAHARGDAQFLSKTLVRQVLFSGLMTGFLAVTLAAMSSWVIPLWTGGIKTADMPLVIACCCLCVLDGFLLPFGVYLNGIGCVRPQAVAAVFAAFTYFPAKVAALAWGGVPAMIWTTIACQVVISGLIYGLVFRREVLSALRSSRFRGKTIAQV